MAAFAEGMYPENPIMGMERKAVPDKINDRKKEQVMLANGMSVFYVEGVRIVALNEKSARKKFSKRKNK